MHFKKAISILTAAALAGSILLSTAANAETADLSTDAQQKAALMEAAGMGSSNSASASVQAVPVKPFDESSVKIKKDEAVKIAEKIMDNPDEFVLGNVGLNPFYGSTPATWNIFFNSKTVNSSNANIAVDADTGRIMNFYIWYNQYGQQNYIATLTRSEAAKLAEEFLINKMKVDMGTYELQKEDPNAYGYKVNGVKEMVTYSFAYARKVDGVYLSNDYIYVSVDGTNGKVTSFSTTYSQIDLSKLPDKTKAITSESALDKFNGILNIALQYINIYPVNPYTSSAPKTMLVYAPTLSSDMIDAVSGKSIGYDGNETVLVANPADLYSNPKQLDPSAVLPKTAEISDADASKRAQEFKAVIEKLIGTEFDNNSNPGDIYYGSSNDSLSYSWYKNQGNVNCNLSITISKKTGLINNIGFGKYDYSKEMGTNNDKPREIKEKVSWGQGKEKALAVLKQLLPEQYGFYTDINLAAPQLTDEAKKSMPFYSYSFMRVVNGIVFRDNNINISIDRETGDVQSFYGNWNDIELPKPGTTITKEAAVDSFMEGMEARLTYFQKSSYDSKTGIQKFDAVPVLVYTFVRDGYYYGSSSYVDAATGRLLDYSGRDIKPTAQANSPKSKGGWADRSIDLLIAQGILKTPFPDFETDMTRGDALKMLSLARGPMYYYDAAQTAAGSFKDVPRESDYFYFVENAVKQGIIPKGGELKIDEKITKAEFVKLLANTLGFAEIAKKSEIFKLDALNIINAGDVGSTAICSALDILPVKSGATFDGSSPITYAEACSALYKALKYIR